MGTHIPCPPSPNNWSNNAIILFPFIFYVVSVFTLTRSVVRLNSSVPLTAPSSRSVILASVVSSRTLIVNSKYHIILFSSGHFASGVRPLNSKGC